METSFFESRSASLPIMQLRSKNEVDHSVSPLSIMRIIGHRVRPSRYVPWPATIMMGMRQSSPAKQGMRPGGMLTWSSSDRTSLNYWCDLTASSTLKSCYLPCARRGESRRLVRRVESRCMWWQQSARRRVSMQCLCAHWMRMANRLGGCDLVKTFPCSQSACGGW